MVVKDGQRGMGKCHNDLFDRFPCRSGLTLLRVFCHLINYVTPAHLEMLRIQQPSPFALAAFGSRCQQRREQRDGGFAKRPTPSLEGRR